VSDISGKVTRLGCLAIMGFGDSSLPQRKFRGLSVPVTFVFLFSFILTYLDQAGSHGVNSETTSSLVDPHIVHSQRY
jgi:hypothetical protein